MEEEEERERKRERERGPHNKEGAKEGQRIFSKPSQTLEWGMTQTPFSSFHVLDTYVRVKVRSCGPCGIDKTQLHLRPSFFGKARFLRLLCRLQSVLYLVYSLCHGRWVVLDY
jgi:hypothetical protein